MPKRIPQTSESKSMPRSFIDAITVLYTEAKLAVDRGEIATASALAASARLLEEKKGIAQ